MIQREHTGHNWIYYCKVAFVHARKCILQMNPTFLMFTLQLLSNKYMIQDNLMLKPSACILDSSFLLFSGEETFLELGQSNTALVNQSQVTLSYLSIKVNFHQEDFSNSQQHIIACNQNMLPLCYIALWQYPIHVIVTSYYCKQSKHGTSLCRRETSLSDVEWILQSRNVFF